ncbi:hypothetical protein [Candidatus Agathobaculum pullicola]
MKKRDLPVVHCYYTDGDKSLSDILEESFRLYLARALAVTEQPIGQNRP